MESECRTEDEEKARRERMGWLREARFGLFVHWGIYAAAGGEWKCRRIGGAGEWIQFCGKIPVKE